MIGSRPSTSDFRLIDDRYRPSTSAFRVIDDRHRPSTMLFLMIDDRGKQNVPKETYLATAVEKKTEQGISILNQRVILLVSCRGQSDAACTCLSSFRMKKRSKAGAGGLALCEFSSSVLWSGSSSCTKNLVCAAMRSVCTPFKWLHFDLLAQANLRPGAPTPRVFLLLLVDHSTSRSDSLNIPFDLKNAGKCCLVIIFII